MKLLLLSFLANLCSNVYAQVDISGSALNYKDTVFYITQTGGFDNFTKAWRDKTVKVSITADGLFKATIPEDGIGSWMIRPGENSRQFFDLIKGREIQLEADFSKEKPLHAIGQHAGDFNFSSLINDQSKIYFKEADFLQKIKSKNVDSVLNARSAFVDFKTRLLHKYKSEHGISTEYYNWLISKFKYEPIERTLTENIDKDILDQTGFSKIIRCGPDDDYAGPDDDYAAMNTSEYNYVVDSFVAYSIRQKGSKKLSLSEQFNYIADGNLLKRKTKEVYLTRFLCWLYRSPDSIYQPMFTKYDKVVNNDQLKQTVTSLRDEHVQQSSAIAIDQSKVSMTAIFSKYKGKVIYIDFWASWCVPCRNEMPNAAVLKSKMKNKDIVFLYFGYKDNEAAWLKARQQMRIEGAHYLLNASATKEAEDLFGINGIPHYAIIDKKGMLVSKRADRPGEVYQQLLKVLEK